jgi:hypothetical protein
MRWILPLVAIVLCTSTEARGDVVMPPPTNCPPGEVGVTSHGGPRCMKEAPRDCPVGWNGILGGMCTLRPCTQDSECGDGQCAEHSVCLEPFEDMFYDYNEKPEAAQDIGKRLFAGPPLPKQRRDKPIIRYKATNLCSSQVTCEAPRTCQPEKLCVPKGYRAVAYLGSNIQPARVARKTDKPITESKAKPDESSSIVTPPPPKNGTPPVTVEPVPPAEKRSGCAGCSLGGESMGGEVLLLALACAALIRKRLA